MDEPADPPPSRRSGCSVGQVRMDGRESMQHQGSVARLLAPVNVHLAVVVVVLAMLGIFGLMSSAHTVDRLTQETTPIAADNAAVQRDMLILQSSTHAWVQSGQRVVLTPYRIAEARLEARMERLEEYAEPGSDLDAAVDQQAEAVARWRAYSDARIARPGGMETYDSREFMDAKMLFDRFGLAHAATTAAFDREIDAAQHAARVVLTGTVAAMVVVGLTGLAILQYTRRRLLRALELPLRNLESVAHRLAENDTSARAEPVGPREVQAVTQALNTLAAAHERAVAVEERLRADQQALDSAKDDFVSNVSHELRTPLTTLNGYLEMVHDEFEGRLSPRHQKMMDTSQRNVDRLKTLIEDLLTLSRSETKEPARDVVDGRELVAEVVDDLRVTAAQRAIRIAVHDELDDVPWIVGDRSQLLRALLNVVGNAVKFSHQCGLVEVGMARQANWLTIEISDHGLGIPEDEIGRIGSRFFRGSNAISQAIGGTGLGLRITQSIIDAHDGEIQIRSRQGAGTTVTVRLRALSTATDAEPPAASAEPCPQP
ncbi:sensor histidine kinase [Nocardioides sp. JS614]|uniref:sensor histidine kinase n=2 Tax=unclassified Nocardioides TaxID=2615069 RepID=UPI00130532B8|nr:HAMP domain-containing sensor histidine kinase [Nocardioides sp. JS614]